MRRVLAVIILTLIIFILLTDDGIFRIVPSTKLKYLGEWEKKQALKWSNYVWFVAELSLSLSSLLHDKQNQEVLDRLMARNVSLKQSINEGFTSTYSGFNARLE